MLALQDGWLQIRYDSLTGWLPADQVSFTKPAETTATETTITTTETTTTETTTTTEAPKTYDVFFSENEILNSLGYAYGGHVFFSTISGLQCSNGSAKLKTETVAGATKNFYAQKGVNVSGASAGAVTISGQLTMHGWERMDGQEFIFDDASAYFSVTKYVG